MGIMTRLENQIGFNLHRVHTLFRRELINCLRGYELNPEQWEVMEILWEKRVVNQKQIHEITLQDLPSISRMIKRMEKKGFIEIECSQEDRRITLIRLTSHGASLENKLIPKVTKHFDGIMNQLPENSKKSFMRILKMFRKMLGDAISVNE